MPAMGSGKERNTDAPSVPHTPEYTREYRLHLVLRVLRVLEYWRPKH